MIFWIEFRKIGEVALAFEFLWILKNKKKHGSKQPLQEKNFVSRKI